MNRQRAMSRVSQVATAATLTVNILFAGAGCARICSWVSKPAASAKPAYAEPAPIAKNAPAEAPKATADTELTSTEPRFGDEMAFSNAAAAQTVNVFGEIKGAPSGAFKPAGESGFQQHTSVDEGEDSNVAVDPSGKWLVFASTRHNEAGDIYLQRVDGTSVTQLTNDAARDAYPTFSPDGKWIAFASTRAGNWQIYRMDLDGRNVVQVTSGPTQAIHPSFSPDGARLVYCSLGTRTQQWELWTVHLVSGERRQIGYGLFPTWSPDKSAGRIAFQRARQRGSRWFSLWTMEVVNGEGRRNTEVAVSSNAAIVTPSWSPDGKKLAFTTVVQPVEGSSGAGQQDVWTIDADGANKHRLTDGNGTNLSPAWASDNRVYFVSNRGGNESVWSVQADAVDTFTASAGHKTEAPAPVAEAHADTKELTH